MHLILPRGLLPRQTQFLCLLAARPSLTRADYQRLLRVSHNTALRDLAQLTAAGLLLPLGSSSSRRYVLGPAAIATDDANTRENAEIGTLMGRAPAHSPATVVINVDPISVPGRDA